MACSLEAGERVTLSRVGIFAVRRGGKKGRQGDFRLTQLYVDEIIRVNNDAICAAIKDVFEDNAFDSGTSGRAVDRRDESGHRKRQAQGQDSGRVASAPT